MPRKAPIYATVEARPRDLSPEQLAAKGALSIEQCAEFLTIGVRTVWELVTSGELPSAKLGRRRVVYRAAAELYLAQHRA